MESYKKGFLSYSATETETLEVIREIYTSEGYVLDPHGAVALRAADVLKTELGNEKLICFDTAHPAKFPKIIKKALREASLPSAAIHHSIERAKRLCEKVHLCDHQHLEEALKHAMETNWELTKGI